MADQSTLLDYWNVILIIIIAIIASRGRRKMIKNIKSALKRFIFFPPFLLSKILKPSSLNHLLFSSL
jgi:hypothetical protein